MGTRARVVANPDTVVLDLLRALLKDLSHPPIFIHISSITAVVLSSSLSAVYLVHGNDLAVGLLDLAELLQKVPEAGLGDNSVGSKDAHTVELRVRLLVRGELATNHLNYHTDCFH